MVGFILKEIESIISPVKLSMLVFAIALLYFIPTISAYSLKKQNAHTVLITNIFLGWTVVGWVVALARALAKEPEKSTLSIEPPKPKPISGSLVELFKLKDQGIITDEEFQEQKRRFFHNL